MNKCFLLLDVGGTFVKSGAATPQGLLLPDAEFTHPIRSEGSKEEIVDSLATVVRRGAAFACDQGFALAGIGVAIPGPFDYAAGIPRMTHKFQSINGTSLPDVLHSLPEIDSDLPIRFVHDVNAVLLGELAHGNAAGFGNAAVVTLGTGLGFTFCRNGEVQYSAIGSPLIPIYNRPYDKGILEDYASKRGFLRVYGELTGISDPALTVADLGRMASEGDAMSLKTFEIVGRTLADSICELLRELEIECLLFGGQISRSFRFFEPALREGLKSLPDLERIVPVKHIGEAAFFGLIATLCNPAAIPAEPASSVG